MEKVVKISKSFEECDRADKAYYHSLTPHEPQNPLGAEPPLADGHRWSS